MVNTLTSAETSERIKALLKKSPDDRVDAARLDELRKIFAELIKQGDLYFSSPTNEISSVRRKWNAFLAKQHKRFVSQLCERIANGKRTAIRTLWGVVASSPTKSRNQKYELISTELLLQWVQAMTQLMDFDQSIINMVQMEFFYPYRDVQYYAMVAMAQHANQLYMDKSATQSHKAEKLTELLMMIPIPSTQNDLKDSSNALFAVSDDAVPDDESEGDEDGSDDERDGDSNASSYSDDCSEESVKPIPNKRPRLEEYRFNYQKITAHHRAWSQAWLAVLRLPLPDPCLKTVLRLLPDRVLPNVPKPLRFADFFMQAYDNEGVIAVLALDGLFRLMIEDGLEYRDFYKQLYKLITPSLLYVKHRIRFFRLLIKCLTRNEMLPAHIVAAFVKRLLRCTMAGPPPSILFVLALCSNLLRKHPNTSCLIHRDNDKLEDKYNPETDDPEEANALQSSLWELVALERHYYPAVATMAKSIGRETELNTPLYDLEEFLIHTYQSLFDQERKRKQKRGTVPLTFQRPGSLLTAGDTLSSIVQNTSS